MSTKNFSKAPPPFEKGENYEKWKRKLELWETFTELDKKKQGSALFFTLDQSSQDAVLELKKEEISGEDGVKKIVKILDRLYLKDQTDLEYQALDDWEEYRRGSNTSMIEYINEYDKRYAKTKSFGTTVSDNVLGYRLLKRANLSESNMNLVRTTVGTITYEGVKTQLKRLEGSFTSKSENVKEEIKIEESDTLYAYQDSNTYRGFKQRGATGFRTQGSYGMRGRPMRYRGRGRLTGTNPVDQFGNISTCVYCGSRYHWIDKCPEKKHSDKSPMNATFIENESTDQSPENYDECDRYYEEANDTYCSVVLYQGDLDAPNKLRSLVYESLGCAVLDCGACKTVCVKVWLQYYLESLCENDRSKVVFGPSESTFKFSDGKTVKSTGIVTIPAIIGCVSLKIIADVVDEFIPLLLSKGSLKRARADLNFANDSIEILGQRLTLIETNSGHYVLPLTRKKACLEAVERDIKANVTLTVTDTLTTNQKAIKLHRQFAHPTADKLIKLLKNAGSTDNDLEEEVKKVTKKCKVCKILKKPDPRPVVGMPMATRFGECVAMDLKKMKNVHLLHVIDHATRFSACAPIGNKNPDTIIKQLFRIWISVYGCPEKFLSDNGGEFANDKFRELCERANILVQTTAAESPWSNGLCERHNLVLADMITKVMEDSGCNIEMAVMWAVHAKNSLANIHGFSPYQLVFGRNPSIPGILTDKPPAMYGESSIEVIRKNLNALHSARETFIKSESSERLKRALRHNIRSSGDVKYFCGDKVYYKRANDKKWKGPGTVLGQDGQQILVKHGSVYIRVHPCRICLERSAKYISTPNEEKVSGLSKQDTREYDSETSISDSEESSAVTGDNMEQSNVNNRTDRIDDGEQPSVSRELATRENVNAEQNGQQLEIDVNPEPDEETNSSPKRSLKIEYKQPGQEWKKVNC